MSIYKKKTHIQIKVKTYTKQEIHTINTPQTRKKTHTQDIHIKKHVYVININGN